MKGKKKGEPEKGARFACATCKREAGELQGKWWVYPNPTICAKCGTDNTEPLKTFIATAGGQLAEDEPEEEVETGSNAASNESEEPEAEESEPEEQPVRRRPQQSQTTPLRLSLLERETKAVMMRQRGATFERIAKELNCTRQAAHQMVMRVLKREHAELREAAQELIATEYRILNEMQMTIYQAAVKGGLFEMDRIIRISESRRKLLGLDAPEAVKIGSLDQDLVKDILGDIGIGAPGAAEARLSLTSSSLGKAPQLPAQ